MFKIEINKELRGEIEFSREVCGDFIPFVFFWDTMSLQRWDSEEAALEDIKLKVSSEDIKNLKIVVDLA